MMRLETAPDQEALAASIATAALGVLVEVQRDGRVPVFVLTGGSMGIAALAAIARDATVSAVDWSRVALVWGDERWLPAGDAERNELQADDALLRALPLDPALVHRVDASDAGFSLDAAAERYASIVDSLGRIDLALFGVGPDGHVASLFPGRDDLLLDGPGVPSALPVRDSPKPPPERVTLTLDAIRRADRVWLLAAGAGKAEAVAQIRVPGPEPLPAARISGLVETVLWADTEALSTS